jgi:hypothetical protein
MESGQGLEKVDVENLGSLKIPPYRNPEIVNPPLTTSTRDYRQNELMDNVLFLLST